MIETSADVMWKSLGEAIISHPGEIGVGREVIVRAFLTRYLPKRFGVSTGFVIDSSGAMSEQMDIVIYDQIECPMFLSAGDVRIFPCESVVCVGQVKSSLSSRRVLREALSNIESAKVLDRSAGGRNLDQKSEEEISTTTNHLHQIHSFLFVCGRTLSENTMREEVNQWIDGKPPHLWPNLVFCFDRYLITYACEGGFCPNTMHARGLAAIRGPDRAHVLRWFLYFVSRVSMAVAVPWFEYATYIGGFPRGTNALYPFDDEPFDERDYVFSSPDDAIE